VLPKHTRRNRPVLISLVFPTSDLSEGTRRVSRRFCTTHASPYLACNVPRTPNIYPPMCFQFVQLASCLTLPSALDVRAHACGTNSQRVRHRSAPCDAFHVTGRPRTRVFSTSSLLPPRRPSTLRSGTSESLARNPAHRVRRSSVSDPYSFLCLPI
jgi:hypothetical protein